MLTKLIKYDFKASARKMLPLIAAVPALALLSGFSLMYLNRSVGFSLPQIFFTLVIIAFVLGIMALSVMAFVVMIERFYKNLLGAEGYLMFTLPVSVDALVWSKLLVSFIWFVLTGVTSLAAMLIFGLSSATVNIGVDEIRYFFAGFGELIREAGAANFVGYTVEFILLGFIGSVTMCLHFYLAMAIGQAFANHKMLWSVVFYFAINFAFSMFTAAAVNIAGNSGMLELLNVAVSGPVQAVHLSLILGIVFSSIVAAIFYFPTTALLKKRLNLA